MMRLVIIESPYKGEVERNQRYLRACIRDCIRRGESPYASHRMLTDALNDLDPDERKAGIEAGLAWAHVRQPVFDSDPADGYILRYNLACHVFYVDLGLSTGMTLARTKYDAEGVLYEERNLPADDPFFSETISPNFESATLEKIRMLLVGAYGGDPDPRTTVEIARAVADELQEWRGAGRAVGIEGTTTPRDSLTSLVRSLERGSVGGVE